MWSTEYTQATSAGPATVWAVQADLERWGEWNAGVARLEVAGPAELGTSFRMTPPGGEALESTVVEFEPERRFTDVTEVDGITVRVEHLLEARGDGTKITYRIEVSGPAPDDVLTEIGAQVSADFPDVLAALARRAEELATS